MSKAINSSKWKFNFSNLLYYVGLSLYIVASTLQISMLGQSDGMQLLISIFRFTGVVLSIFSIIIRNRLKKIFLFWIVLISAIFLLVMIRMGDHGGFLMVIIMIGAWKANPHIIAKIHLCCAGLIVFVGVIASKLGLIEDRISYFYRTSVVMLERHSWGMTYTTIFAGICFFILASYLYVKKNRMKLIEFIILICISWWIYQTTRSRLELFMMTVLIVSYIMLPFLTKLLKNKIVTIIIKNIFLLCFLTSFLLTLIYMSNPQKYTLLNDFMSGRLSLTAQAILQYGFSLFGTNIAMQGGGTINIDLNLGYFFIDSFYMNWLLVYGIVLMIALTLFFYWIMDNLVSGNNNSKIIIFVSLACIHGIIISSIMQPQMNPLFLIALAEISNHYEIPKDVLKIKRGK